MNYAQQIIETIQESAVKTMLVVDDAYDPPNFEPQIAGDLLEVLEGEGLRTHVTEDLLSEEKRGAAVTALKESESDHEAVTDALAVLYEKFVDTRANEIDPGGAFNDAKGTALDVLDPLIELLRRCCDEAQVRTVGTDHAVIEDYRKLKPDLIFMDFYLSPPERTTRGITKGQIDGDRKRSITLLKSMLSKDTGRDPAVILISSEDVADRKATYLGNLKDRVMALRFGYLHKRWVSGAGEDLCASFDASDVLMDMSRSFEFAQTLEAALKTWRTGVEGALDTLDGELRKFDIKDFAYLLRFRLYEEGEPFADYLEWFLGESLRAVVDEEVEWATKEFLRLDDDKLTKAIEGAHPLPSDRTAKFFHRLRFNSRENRPRKRFALGDLFVAPGGKSVRMVISPDCDLVSRGEKPTANRILTIGGTIRNLQEDHAVAGDLIFHNSPKTIKWNFKNLMTHKFGNPERLDVEGTDYEFFASMRPMSAQTIQKAALADLSRVGTSVPPIVYFGAPVKIYLRKNVKNQAKLVGLEGLSDPLAQVFIPRGGEDKKMRALFTSKFVRDFLEKLEKVDAKQLSDHDREQWSDCIKNAQKVQDEMLHKGIVLPGEGISKIKTSFSEPKGKNKNWLQIVIDVSDEARINLYGMYPLNEEDEC